MASPLQQLKKVSTLSAPRIERGSLLENVLRRFLESRKNGEGTAKVTARPRTLQNYENDLKYFMTFMAVAPRRYTRWNEITKVDAREFIAWVREQESWADASKSKILRSVRALFNWMNGDEECEEQGMRAWPELVKVPKTRPRPFSPNPEDLARFMGAMNQRTRAGMRDYTFCSLVAGTGLRSGEVRYLKLNQLNLDDNQLTVPKEGKSNWRTVYLSDEVVKDLRRWLEVRETFAQCDYVFVNDEGHFVEELVLAHSFRRHRERTGIGNGGVGKNITPHTLRHYYCTEWIKNDGNLFKLKSQAGHKRIETLEGYVHVIGDQTVRTENDRINVRKKLAGTERQIVSPRGKKRVLVG